MDAENCGDEPGLLGCHRGALPVYQGGDLLLGESDPFPQLLTADEPAWRPLHELAQEFRIGQLESGVAHLFLR